MNAAALWRNQSIVPAADVNRLEHARHILIAGIAGLVPLASPLAALLAGPALLFLLIRGLANGVRLPFLGLSLAGAAVLAEAVFNGSGLVSVAAPACWVLLAVVVPVNLLERHSHLLRFLRSWLAMAMVISLASLASLPDPFRDSDALAAHLAVSALLALMYRTYAGASGRRWFIVVMPVLLAGIASSGSRVGALALAVGLLVYGVLRDPFRTFLAATVLVTAGGMAVSIVPTSIKLVLFGGADGPSLLVALLVCALLLGASILMHGHRRAVEATRPAFSAAAASYAFVGFCDGFGAGFASMLLLAGIAAAVRAMTRKQEPAPKVAAPARLRFNIASLLFGLMAMMFTSSCATVSSGHTVRVSGDLSLVETGTHWADPSEFPMLKRLGYQFAIITLDENPKNWQRAFDAAEQSGIRLIAGLYPYPYKWEKDRWTISLAGQEFLRYAATRKTLVKAVYGFNEPLLTDPATGKQFECGAVDAPRLRMLRTQVRQIYSGARIYHDLGQPSAWAPGGYFARKFPCIGDKYGRTTGIADFAGVWYYPMSADGKQYLRDRMITAVQREVDYVTEEMLAQPVVLAQAFRCKGCPGAARMPGVEETKDMNCRLRELAPHAMSWYAWRQDTYDEVLSVQPSLWPMTNAAACSQ